MRLMRTLPTIATLSAALLTGCATQPLPVLIKPAIPVSLLTCAAQPAPPVKPTNGQVADFILALAAAGDECRSRLSSVKALLQ